MRVLRPVCVQIKAIPSIRAQGRPAGEGARPLQGQGQVCYRFVANFGTCEGKHIFCSIFCDREWKAKALGISITATPSAAAPKKEKVGDNVLSCRFFFTFYFLQSLDMYFFTPSFQPGTPPSRWHRRRPDWQAAAPAAATAAAASAAAAAAGRPGDSPESERHQRRCRRRIRRSRRQETDVLGSQETHAPKFLQAKKS